MTWSDADHDMLPRVLPSDWTDLGMLDLARLTGVGQSIPVRHYEQGGRTPMTVFVGVENRGDAGRWLHSSFSYPTRLPTWADVRRVHEVIHGSRLVIQVLPPPDHYLNAMRYCLHLFERLDADTVPDGLWREP